VTKYVLSPEAVEDIEEIRSYLLDATTVPVARYVLRELREQIKFLAKNPGAGHLRHDLTEQPVKFWPVFSYLIVYRSDKRPIEVVRVLHGNRDLGVILKNDNPQ
jgi:plasmid stabilization system protein ParE